MPTEIATISLQQSVGVIKGANIGRLIASNPHRAILFSIEAELVANLKSICRNAGHMAALA